MKNKVQDLKNRLKQSLVEATKIPRKKTHHHLPNLHPEDPMHDVHQNLAHDIAVTNPKLFRKIQNWD